ncbi:sodium/bile acid cotransporter 7-B isoform X2 [Anabrus simplex]|uniref:sodium/bile acid cotransporter 7-B isoform X2 n=1 Tax=Anabrus simplex TaxID=316456 RepID=UPI0034DD072A
MTVKTYKKRMNPWLLWQRQWFLIAILTVILMAEIYPKLGARGGPLKPEITIKYGAVSIIFFLSGLILKTDELLRAAKQYDLHLFVQIFTLILMPLFVKCVTVCLMLLDVDEWVLKGLVVASCMPPSSSSAVIITRAVGGNEAAAVFNSALGSVLGIIVTPFTLLFFLRTTALVPPLATMMDLLLTVTLPISAGQLICYLTGFRMPREPLEKMGQVALLLVIYTTFCDTFISHESAVLHPMNIVLAVLFVVVLQVMMLCLIFFVGTRMNIYSPQDVIAILFCSTHKSLALGIPILRALYSGYEHLPTISLPLLVYYPTQIILGGLLIGDLRDLLRNKRSQISLPA